MIIVGGNKMNFEIELNNCIDNLQEIKTKLYNVVWHDTEDVLTEYEKDLIWDAIDYIVDAKNKIRKIIL